MPTSSHACMQVEGKRPTATFSHSGRSSCYVLYQLMWMGARRPPPDPDPRRPAGADRPCPAPPAQLLVEGSGAGGGRHHLAHLQSRALIDPTVQMVPEPGESGVMERAWVCCHRDAPRTARFAASVVPTQARTGLTEWQRPAGGTAGGSPRPSMAPDAGHFSRLSSRLLLRWNEPSAAVY